MKSKDSLNPDKLAEIAKDIPRHSYTKYLNRNTLSEAFFQECEESLKDEHLYVVISSTGSSASELISVFTRKEYNHVSLSFDRELKTVLSYNGGGSLYPPGLNREQLEYFRKKDDASILVYRLDAPIEKKRLVLEKDQRDQSERERLQSGRPGDKGIGPSQYHVLLPICLQHSPMRGLGLLY